MNARASAQQMFDAGMQALANKDKYPAALPHAYKCFSAACFADPTWQTAFYQAGNNNIDLKMVHAAIAAYRRALECEGDLLERAKVLCNLGWQFQAIGESDEALRVSHEAVKLDPSLSQAYLNLSVINRDIGNEKESLRWARKAFEIEPNINNEICLAFALLFDGQYAKGLEHFDKRFEWRLKHFLNYPYPQWHREPGKTVLLVADQGLGDTLSYARFVRALCERSQYVHMVIQHELLRLFQHAFFDIKNLNIIPGLNANFPAADGWTTFVSLPHALGLTDEEIVAAKPIAVPEYGLPKTWKVPGRKLHIGFAWAGSPLNDIDAHRNIPVTQFYDLYRVPGIQLYSLQVGDRAKELTDTGGAPVVQDLSPYIHDIVDTMTLLRDLDLVITCESALGHICAALGRECWIPYSKLGKDYRLGCRGEKKLWTPNHRVFLQGDDRQWQPVFDEMVDALKGRVK